MVGIANLNDCWLLSLLNHGNLLVLEICCGLYRSETCSATAAWRYNILLLELSQLLLLGYSLDLCLKVWILREKATFVSSFVLCLVKGTLFNDLGSVAWIARSSTSCNSRNVSRVCGVTVFSLDRLCNG